MYLGEVRLSALIPLHCDAVRVHVRQGARSRRRCSLGRVVVALELLGHPGAVLARGTAQRKQTTTNLENADVAVSFVDFEARANFASGRARDADVKGRGLRCVSMEHQHGGTYRRRLKVLGLLDKRVA